MVAKRTIQPVDISFLEEKDRYLSSIPEYERTSTNLRRESAASRILQEEGIGSAKDVLSGMQIPSARSIVESEFGTTPTTTPPTTTPEVDQTKTLLGQKKPEPPKADQKTLDAIKEIETKIQTAQALKPKTQIEMEEKANLPFYQEQLAGLKDKAARDASRKETFQQKMDRAAAEGVPYYTYFNESDYASYENDQNIKNKEKRKQELKETFQQKMERAAAKGVPYYTYFNESDYASYEDDQNRKLKEKRKQEQLQIKQQEKEDELLRKEQEFINNFKADSGSSLSSIKSNKYGTLTFNAKEATAFDVRYPIKPKSAVPPPPENQVVDAARWQNTSDLDRQKIQEKANLDLEKDKLLSALHEQYRNGTLSSTDYEIQNINTVRQHNNKLTALNSKYNALFREERAKPVEQQATPFTYSLTSTAGSKSQDFVFLPEDHIIKGFNGSGGYYLNTAFLDKNTWGNLFESSQPVNLEGMGIKAGNAALGRGFLFSKDDWNKFKSSNNLENKFYGNAGFNNPYMPDNQPILGIGSVNGELKYIRQAGYKVGKDTINTAYINNDGSTYYSYTTKHSGVRGVAQDIAEGFAEIPFGAEFIGIATGSPALYASLKGLQTAGMGGDVGDVFKSMAVGYATASVATNLGGYGEAFGKSIAATTGLPVAVANAAGGAIVGATFNGTMAAVTGGDVQKAMLAGAIGGGAQATAAEFTNTVMGGEANVKAMASAVNLNVKQFQQIFTGAVANGAIAESVYGRDFMDAFSTSLVTQGVSTAAANTVAKNLDKTMSPAARKTVVQGTQMYVAAAARAAVRGEDMATAIKNSTPEYIARLSGAAIRESTRKSN